MTDLAIDPGVAAATRTEPGTRDLTPLAAAVRRTVMFLLALLLVLGGSVLQRKRPT